MKTKKIILVGTSAFAEVAYEYFTHDSEYEVVAFAVEAKFKTEDKKFGLPIVTVESCADVYKPDDFYFYAAITYKELNYLRSRLYNSMKNLGYKAASYISSKAYIWPNVDLGEHVFIFENNVIQPFSKIDTNVVLWSGNHIGHHSSIRKNCFISSHVVISGFCDIGEHTFIGVNATIADRVSVGKDNFIGSSAIILSNTTENSIYQSVETVKHKIPAKRLFKVKKQ